MPDELEQTDKKQRKSFLDRLVMSITTGWKRALLRIILSFMFLIVLGLPMLQHQFNLLGKGMTTLFNVIYQSIIFSVKRAFIIVYPYLISIEENVANKMFGDLLVTGILSIMAFLFVYMWVSAFIDLVDLAENDAVNVIIKLFITFVLVILISLIIFNLTGVTDLTIPDTINQTAANTSMLNNSNVQII